MLHLFRKIISGRNSYSRQVLWIIVALAANVLISACDSDNEKSETSDASIDSGRCDGDDCIEAETGIDSNYASPDAGSVPDATIMDADTGSGESGPTPGCVSDVDCKKRADCSGEVACVFDDDDDAGLTGHCECNCDSDGDNVLAIRCGGDDCNDNDGNIRPGASEVCDPDGVDEDCDLSTCTSGDQPLEDNDGDGFISTICFNRDQTGKKHYAKKWDCDDTRKEVNPEAEEKCDNLDNDCNGYVDEEPNEHKHGGLRHSYYPDRDGDHWGSNTGRIFACSKPTGYVEQTEDDISDCDDSDDAVYPKNEEICDGKDNDCDGETDELPLSELPTFHNTTVICKDGEPTIPPDGCPEGFRHCTDSILQGCETPDDTLSTCKACETNCLFSCGEDGCDEIEKLSVGGFHACAITAEGRAACWGRNYAGQLGNDTTNVSSVPVQVIGITDVKDISAGHSHTCAIVGTDRTLYCWGRNDKGQLGVDMVSESIHVPERTLGFVDALALTQTESVAVGTEHTCAVSDGGTVSCWGYQKSGRLGNYSDDENSQLSPGTVSSFLYGFPTVIENGSQIVVGRAHSCVLTDEKKVLCWGDNSEGQLGDDGAESSLPYAQEVSNLPEIESITAGIFHTCALSTSGQVYCWGGNGRLQLGHPDDENNDIPVEVPGLDGIEVIDIIAGGYHTCALSISSELMCWGSNGYGERGDENHEETEVPVIVSIDPVDRIAAGGAEGDGISCARMQSGQAACWGNNKFGQLGNGEQSTEFQPEPQLLSALKGSTP